MEKVYVLENKIIDYIDRDLQKSSYHIKIKKDFIPKEIKIDIDYAKGKKICFLSSYNKDKNYDYVNLHEYENFEEFSKNYYLCIANNLLPLSSFCIVHTSDNKLIFLEKNEKIFGISGYINEQHILNDNIDIYKHLISIIKYELNIFFYDIKNIFRIGQIFSKDIDDENDILGKSEYNNNFYIDLKISSKQLIEKFKDNKIVNLVIIDDNINHIMDFIIKKQKNISTYCIASLYNYLVYKYNSKNLNEFKCLLSRCKIIDNLNAKNGFDKSSNILKQLKIFNWGLIGNSKIKYYSVAPQMWKALFSYLNFPINYFVLAEDDEEYIRKCIKKFLKDDTFIGANVAMPWKKVAFENCDYVDSDIKELKTINTIIATKDKIRGYNTDGIGLINAIKNKTKIINKSVLLMGAGGASQTIPLYLLDNGIKSLYIYDIKENKSRELVEHYNSLYINCNKFIKYISKNEIGGMIEKIDIIINATPCGMVEYEQEFPFDKTILKKLKKDAVIAETVYNPYRTPLIDFAKQEHVVCEGVNMLVEQAAISFYHAFGIKLSKKSKHVMEVAAINALMEK